MKKSNLLSWVIVAIFSVGLLSCGGGGGSIISNTPSDAVKRVFNQFKDKNYEAAAKNFIRKDGTKLTKEETDKVIGLLTFGTKQNEEKKGLKGVEIVSETIAQDGNSAEVSYKILYNDGSDKSDHGKLLKVGGDWYLIIGN